ncbi:MAG: hypothetical protein ACM35E_01735, partial [Deltaproteobacteria bacterium]
NIMQAGGMPELAAALNSGSISAAPLSAPSSYVAEQRGNRVIANLAHEGIYFVIAGLTTTRRFLREQRRDAESCIRPIIRMSARLLNSSLLTFLGFEQETIYRMRPKSLFCATTAWSFTRSNYPVSKV